MAVDAQPDRGWRTVDIYDSATGQWTTAQLSGGRCCMAAVAVGPLALLAGGGGPMGDSETTVDIYDSRTGRLSRRHSWTS